MNMDSQIVELATGVVNGLGDILLTATKGALSQSIQERLTRLLNRGEAADEGKLRAEILSVLREYNIDINSNEVKRVVSSAVTGNALVVKATGVGTVGRILQNGAREDIIGTQYISVDNGAVGEIISGSTKTITSVGGANPGLSVNVNGSGTGMKVEAGIDENGVQYGGISVTKSIR